METVTHVIIASIDALIVALCNARKAALASITADTVPSMNKTDNPFWGKVVKRSIVQFQVGVDFDTACNNKRERDGLERREIQARKWGVHIDGTPLVAHMKKGESEIRLYLPLQVLKALRSVYIDLETGAEIAKDAIKPYLKPSAPSEEGIYQRDYDVRGIVRFAADGQVFVLDKGFRLSDEQMATAARLLQESKAAKAAKATVTV
jgi:hypothetical protein